MSGTFLDYDEEFNPIIVENLDYTEFLEICQEALEKEAEEGKIVEAIETLHFVGTMPKS